MSEEPEESAAEGNASSLRQRAEAAMLRLGNSGRIPEAEDLASLIQELTIHQIELEMQGEELRRSSESLSATKRLYFRHFQAAPVPIIRFAHDGSVIETNLAGADLLGTSLRASSAKPRHLIERMLAGGDLARFQRLLADASAATRPVQADVKIQHPKLGERIFAVTALALPRTDGPQVLTYFQDDTQARKNSAEFERLSLIARHTENMVIFTGPDRKITWVNEGFLKLTGYSLEDVFGKSPSLLQGVGTDQATVKRMRIALNEGRPVREEILNFTKSGRPYWVSIEVIPRRNSSGQLTGFMSIQRDVTHRRNRETQLLKLRTAVEQSANTIVITDTDGNIEYVNPAFERTTGYKASEVLGKNPRVLSSGEQTPEFYLDLWAKITGGQTWKGVFHNKRKDGSLYWETATISPVLDAGGRISNYIAVKENITERVDAEQALRHEHDRLVQVLDALEDERQRLANVIEGTGLGTWEWNIPAGNLVINERWAEICGYSCKELGPVGIEVWRRLVHPEDLAGAQEALERHFRGDLLMYDVVFRMLHKSGQWVWVRSAGRIIDHTPEGLPLMMYGTHTDITREKLREEAIREANSRLKVETERAEAASRAKGDFLANMSHEIRTPLNAIIGMSELLENDPSGPDAREFLHTIRSSGDALLALINDILDFSKIEAGQLDLERVPVNLRECAEGAINTISLAADRRSLRVVSEIDPALPSSITGDPHRLRQILVNLLNNAVKFTEQGEIELRIFRSGDSQIGFAVRDTGIGITPEQQEKLFQSFSQADPSTTRRFGGTGLGLAISRKLVEMMGGAIRVDSGQGVGSTFHFAIPLVKSDAPAAKPGRKPSAPQPDAHLASRIPMSILIVEDNLVNQRLVEMMLRRLGYTPALAANGLEALAALEKSRYDLVFMDIQMPEMDGLLATRKICEIYPPDTRPQIVALTANAMDGDREVCLAAGMHDYLAKPVRHEHLAGAIERGAVRAGILKTR